MNIRFPFLFLALLLIAGCSEDGDREVGAPAGSPKRVDKSEPDERGIVREEPRFASSDRGLEEIMEDFAGSIDTFPTVDQGETTMKKNEEPVECIYRISQPHSTERIMYSTESNASFAEGL